MRVVRVSVLFAAAAAAAAATAAAAAAAAEFSPPISPSDSGVLTEESETGTEQDKEVSRRLPEDVVGVSLPSEETAAAAAAAAEAAASEGGFEAADVDHSPHLPDKLGELREKMKILSRRFGPHGRGSIRTVWIGTLTALFFLFVLSSSQMSGSQGLRDGVFSEQPTRITFAGAGLIMACAVLLTGLQETIQYRIKTSRDRMRQAKSYISAGREWGMLSSMVIALGFIFGAPQAFLKLFTIAFFWFFGISLLGVGMGVEELKNRAAAARALQRLAVQILQPLQQDGEISGDRLKHILMQIERLTSGTRDKQKAAAEQQETLQQQQQQQQQRGDAEAAKKSSKKRQQQRGDLGALLTNTVDVEAMFAALDKFLKGLIDAERERAAARASGAAADTGEAAAAAASRRAADAFDGY